MSDIIYYLSGFGILVFVPLLLALITTFLIKPQILHKKLGREISRKRILGFGTIIFFCTLIGFSGVLAVTEPESIKQERIQQQKAEAAALEKQKQAAEQKTKVLNAETSEPKSKSNKTEIKTETKTEVLVFTTVKRNDSSLTKGKTRVIQQGVDGSKTTTYEVTFQDGEEVERTVIKQDTKPATLQIIAVGTYVTPIKKPAQRSTGSSSSGVVKMSDSGICHAPGTTYYDRTTNFTPYPSISACLNAGGKLPKR